MCGKDLNPRHQASSYVPCSTTELPHTTHRLFGSVRKAKWIGEESNLATWNNGSLYIHKLCPLCASYPFEYYPPLIFCLQGCVWLINIVHSDILCDHVPDFNIDSILLRTYGMPAWLVWFLLLSKRICHWDIPVEGFNVFPWHRLQYKSGVPQSHCGFQYESCHILDTTYPSAYVLLDPLSLMLS